MSKEKNEDITDGIHSEPETDELEESNEVSDEERIAELEDTILRLRAELDNSHKRSVAEVEKAHNFKATVFTVGFFLFFLHIHTYTHNILLTWWKR